MQLLCSVIMLNQTLIFKVQNSKGFPCQSDWKCHLKCCLPVLNGLYPYQTENHINEIELTLGVQLQLDYVTTNIRKQPNWLQKKMYVYHFNNPETKNA